MPHNATTTKANNERRPLLFFHITNSFLNYKSKKKELMINTNRNWEINKEDNSLTIFVNPRIFPLSVVKKVAALLQEDYEVAISGDPDSDILIEIFSKKKTDFNGLARTFNDNLVRLSSEGVIVDSTDASLVTKIRGLTSSFIKSEKGNISKDSILQIGALLAAVGLGSISSEVVSANHCECSTCTSVCGEGCGGWCDPVDSGGQDCGCGDCGCGCCFPKGTSIVMYDGSIKSIEEIQIGDEVLSFDPVSQSYSSGAVKGLESPIVEGYLVINGGLLKITEEHPLFIQRKNGEKIWASFDPWKTWARSKMKVSKIEIGDCILHSTAMETGGILLFKEQWIQIASAHYVEGEVQTYNLKSVEGKSTFFADGFLVHNKYLGDKVVM